ncbi:MAG TPA: hypothetical protein DCL21_05695 [Alphaproteobacteria bacterium]|nr:hypothetical protein [Alphaproteobacteria bacterium]
MTDHNAKTDYSNLLSTEKMACFNSNFPNAPFKSYLLNVEISKHFFVWLHFFEITLRNRISTHLNKHWPDWYMPESYFCNEILTKKHKSKIKYAHTKFLENDKNDGKTITVNNVISDLSFGFWTAMFNEKYHKKIWMHTKHKKVFYNTKMTKLHDISMNLSMISDDLNSIREIRNRIMHCEQIISHAPELQMKNIIRYLSSIIPNKDISIICDIKEIAQDKELDKSFSELSMLKSCDDLKFNISWSSEHFRTLKNN